MPWWVPSFDNGALAALLTFVCGMFGWYVKTMLPAWRDQAIAKARKTEEDAKTAESTRENHAKLIDLTERSIDMQSANTGAIATMASLAGTVDRRVEAVWKHLLSGCKCDGPKGT